MQIKFYNTPNSEEFNHELISEIPKFVDYQPDFALIQKFATKYANFKNIIVIGYGGSVTAFAGIAGALQNRSSKQIEILSTVDPVTIARILKQYQPGNTVVVAISKSGETITQLEALSLFFSYPLLIITGSMGPLAEIAHRLKADSVVHPPIGGRFTGLTEVALLPAALCGFDVEQIYKGGEELLSRFKEDNIAFKAASIFGQLEQKGFVDVYMPIYSDQIFAMSKLIIQLCHESFGKDGKGQTYFAHQAPESQHSTNQRFFGGQKNIIGWFFGVEDFPDGPRVTIPETLQSVPLRDRTLGMLDQIPFEASLQFEREATFEDAKLANIPLAEIILEQVIESELGRLIAFWQLYAVYGSLLRGVNPFDQPQVENSKKISFAKREQYKGLL